ncbi:MAG TPA: hypothetical protein VM577_15075 [Anaerovoracaceae bacterium]|nr:hypothetical protein [Anaerovoracaceae bacterium]
MKIKLVLARTESDNVSVAWTATKTIEVEIPIVSQNDDGIGWWNIIGAEWPSDGGKGGGER